MRSAVGAFREARTAEGRLGPGPTVATRSPLSTSRARRSSRPTTASRAAERQRRRSSAGARRRGPGRRSPRDRRARWLRNTAYMMLFNREKILAASLLRHQLGRRRPGFPVPPGQPCCCCSARARRQRGRGLGQPDDDLLLAVITTTAASSSAPSSSSSSLSSRRPGQPGHHGP